MRVFFQILFVLWSPGAIERVGDSCGHWSHPRLSIGVKWLRSKFLEPSNLDESNIRPRIPHPTSDPSVSSKGFSGAVRMWNLTLMIQLPWWSGLYTIGDFLLYLLVLASFILYAIYCSSVLYERPRTINQQWVVQHRLSSLPTTLLNQI